MFFFFFFCFVFFFFVFFSIFSFGGHCVQQSKMILSILIEGQQRSTSVNYFEIRPLAQEMSFKVFLFCFFSSGVNFFSGAERFEQFW